MKTKSVRVNYGRTINMGNYESLRLDYAMEVELGPKDTDPHKIYSSVRTGLRLAIDKAIQDELKEIR